MHFVVWALLPNNLFHQVTPHTPGNSSYPLCVGLAVLTQLRAQLMDAQFNECILLFSDMPAVDIDNVVSTSMDIFCTTPPSLSWRQHDSADSVAGRSGPLDMTQLPINVLKAEKVGRVSGADLLNLLDLGVGDSSK